MIKWSIRLALVAAASALAAASAESREIVSYAGMAAPGTIVIHSSERRLYYVLGDGTAVRYPVAVGKLGKQWFGTAQIDGKYLHPDWAPPADVKRDNPR